MLALLFANGLENSQLAMAKRDAHQFNRNKIKKKPNNFPFHLGSSETVIFKEMGSQDTENVTLEEHIILRLPLVDDEARKVHEILHYKPEKLKKLLKIDIDPNTSKVTVYLGEKVLFGKMKRLPTIIESYKTNICNNKSMLFKIADLCHIVQCFYEEIDDNKMETNQGYCEPLKNVKRKRFRKTMYNKDFAIETEEVSRELYYLLSTDLEAVSTKFEIINNNSEDTSSAVKQEGEYLFGDLTTTSESESSA